MKRMVTVLVLAVMAVLAATLIPLTMASGGADHRTAAVKAADAATVRTARCHEWEQMDTVHRKAMVEGMHEFFTAHLDIPGAYGTGLTRARAMKLFNGYCAAEFADNFRLYRLYGDAATFTPTVN